MQPARQHFWIFLGYLALSVWMTWPQAADLGGTLGGGIDPLFQAWVLAWDAHALATNPLAIWDAPIFAPYPNTLAYSDHHILLALVSAPLIWLNGHPVLAYNLLVLFSYALSGLAVYLLARSFWPDHTPWAAFLAGAAFAFCSFRMAQFVHLQMLQTAWLPLALYALHRVLGSPAAPRIPRWRDALLLALWVALQAVTALYYSYFVAVALLLFGGLWLVAWLRQRRPLPMPLVVRVLVAALLALAMIIPFSLPYQRVYQSLAIVRSAGELANWSAPLQAYLASDPGNWLYGRFEIMRASGGEFALFPGLLIGLLASGGLLLSLRAAPQRRIAIFLIGLAGIGFVLSLGTVLRLVRGGDSIAIPLPYSLLYERLPGFGALRVPARWGMLVGLALCVLSTPALGWLLARASGRWQTPLALLLLGLILAESATTLPLARAPDLRTPQPIYAWLAEPAQQNIRGLLELPVGQIQRGEELNTTMLRQYAGITHWRPTVVGFSGLMPFGTNDLIRWAQALPNPEAITFLTMSGVDTLILHSDAYDSTELSRITNALDQSAQIWQRVDLPGAIVYRLKESIPLDLCVGDEVLISTDERMPGVLALHLMRRWQANGATIYGGARPRYYAAQAKLPYGYVPSYALLASAEDPLRYGFSPGNRVWQSSGLSFYQRAEDLRASVDLGVVPGGQFHPAFPKQLSIQVDQQRAIIAGESIDLISEISTNTSDTAWIEFDLASLGSQQLITPNKVVQLAPGLNRVAIPVRLGQAIDVRGRDGVVLLRVRILAQEPAAATQPNQGLVAVATARFEGSRLIVDLQAAGAESLLIEGRGAAARDDRPIQLLDGVLQIPTEAADPISFSVDLLNPQEPWLEQATPAADGRYQIVIKDRAQPEAPGMPIATFVVRNGQISDPRPVPLPLNVVP
ncbi:MAG: hypothetical protein Fur005_37410 [Roseiflexaceae bacterium]